MLHFKKTLVVLAAAILLAQAPAALAQSAPGDDMASRIAQLLAQIEALKAQLAALQGGESQPAWCHTFDADLTVGAQGSEVSALWTALNKEGLAVNASQDSFDEDTAAAVVSFQQKYGIRTTGYVGPLTRARLNSLYGCGGKNPPVIVPPRSLITLNPNQGPVGTKILISGGTSAANNRIGFESLDGSRGRYVDVDLATGMDLSFVVPATLTLSSEAGDREVPTQPGLYQLVVSNRWGKSNSAYFTVTSAETPSGAPVISGVSGPTVLSAGQPGTWAVQASDPQNGNLYYKVLWGDEPATFDSAAGGSSVIYQQSATFTHAYDTPGTYTPVFTVANSLSKSQTSLSVKVGGNAAVSPRLMYPNGGEMLYAGNTYQIRWNPGGLPSGTLLRLELKNTRYPEGSESYSPLMIANYVSNTGSYAWRIDPNTSQYGSSFKISIEKAGGAGVYDQSDAVFTILPGTSTGPVSQATVRVTSPNGGDTWTQGKANLISWQGGKGQVKIGLVAEQVTNTIDPTGTPYYLKGWIASGAPNSSAYWDGRTTCDAQLGACQPLAPGRYKIIALTADDVGNYVLWDSMKNVPGNWDVSDAAFALQSAVSTSGAPVISGVSGPTTLNAGQQGTWTVKASDPRNGTLYYTVVWGDEYAAGTNATVGYAPVYQQSATFTHAYKTTGVYTPKFTVANNLSSSQTSLSVNVGGGTTSPGKFSMTSISGVQNTYPPGAKISLSIKGEESDGSLTTPEKGFNIQAYVYNSVRTNYSSGGNATYDYSTGLWKVTLDAPAAAGAYSLRVDLYCSRSWQACGKYADGGTGDDRYYDFTVSSVSSPGTNVAISIDASTPPARQILMGSAGNLLAAFLVRETANSEDVKITDITIADTASPAGPNGFGAMTLNCGNTPAGNGIFTAVNSAWNFRLTSPCVLSRNGSLLLTLRGDAVPFSSVGASGDNISHTFALTVMSALGVSSNQLPKVTFPAGDSNPQTLLRSKLAVSGSTLGQTSGRVQAAVDDLANVVFSAAQGGADATVSKITLTFLGPAAAASFQVSLIDPNTGTFWAGTTAQATAGGSGRQTATFQPFSANISAGSSKTVKVRVDSSNFTGGSLTAVVNGISDLAWGDGAVQNLSLESAALPVSLATVSYQAQSQPVPPLVFTSPAAGASLAQGNPATVSWTGGDTAITSYAVYLIGGSFGPTGSRFLGTASNSATGGYFNWTVPMDVSPGSGYQIQLSGAKVSGGNSPSFSIVAPTPTVMLPSLSSVNPAQGTAGDAVTIYGANLSGATAAHFYGSSGQLAAALDPASSASTVSFTLPSGFGTSVPAGTYQVKVVTPGGVSNGLNFTVTAPAVARTCSASIYWNSPQTSYNGSATETWSVQGADTVYGDCGNGSKQIGASGIYTFPNITAQTTPELQNGRINCRVWGNIGSSNNVCSASAEVKVAPSCSISWSATSPTETWSVQGADTVYGDCGNGEMVISPGPQSYTFTYVTGPITCKVRGVRNDNNTSCSAQATYAGPVTASAGQPATMADVQMALAKLIQSFSGLLSH